MAVLVVGGGGRGTGKTAVACGLMRAVPELRWAAVKVSPHSHGPGNVIWEEHDPDSEKDTGRYLQAGAKRAFLVQGSDDANASVMAIRTQAADCDAVLVESNRILANAVAKSGEPMASIVVLSRTEEDWKASLLESAGKIDAVVLANDSTEVPFGALDTKHFFVLKAGMWISTELIDFIRNRLLPEALGGWNMV